MLARLLVLETRHGAPPNLGGQSRTCGSHRSSTLVASEQHARSPATRWYTQDQAAALYQQAGFVNVRRLSGFSHQPASAEDTLFTILGTLP
jgi:hypothetical protein